MDEFVKHPVVHGGRNGTRKQSYGWSLACVDGRVFGFVLLKKGNTGKKNYTSNIYAVTIIYQYLIHTLARRTPQY